MAVTTGQLSLEWKDYSKESSTLTLQIPVITAANFDARIGEVDAFVNAVEAITYGEMMKFVVGNRKAFSSTASENPLSRRESKIVVHWSDETALKNGWFEIPCINYSTLTFIAGSDEINMADAGVAAALKTAVENLIQSQFGNDVTVTSMTAVGRNT